MSNEPIKSEVPVDLESLADWMDGVGLEAGPILEPELLTGGTQNILLQFKRADRDFVLRRPPVHMRESSNKTMQREALVLQALSGSDVPHPGFIASCDDARVLGAYFYLMEPVDGFNPANGLPALHRSDPDIRRRMGLSYIEGIAALGAIDYKSAGLDGFGKPDGFLERQPGRWLGQMESYAAFDEWTGLDALPDIGHIVTWLEKYGPKETRPGILHGDCHLANTMFRHDSAELAALVDWELATVGDPLVDLGWVIATWPTEKREGVADVQPWDGFPTLEELIAHYGNRTSRNMDSVYWYGVLACFKLATILEGTHARATAGKAPKELGDRLHRLAIQQLEYAHFLISVS